MHELKTGLYADKLATFWMLRKPLPIIRFANDPFTLYNRLNASRLVLHRRSSIISSTALL